ncbi:hypothetical protein Cgig2_001786 [Carnegiea gigantea]|uniref:Uncharacterized protein n=1 Tax=Carnegiea gigantea TaxID=171969 RepID=A0A9Q1QHF8_9CARY|nr:hypothetical protein Cgig2_001786 [Carnegiea gigantea]
MPPHGRDDEFDSDDEVLVKRIKKIKQAQKSRPKQIQSPKSPVKRGQLSVLQYDQQQKFPKQHANTTIRVLDPKSVQSVPKPERETQNPKRFFRPKYQLQVILYISADKKIENTPMDVHLTYALPIGAMKVEEFYGKKTKDAKHNEVRSAWRKEWNLQDRTPRLSRMPQYILSQASAMESFKRNFMLYMT